MTRDDRFNPFPGLRSFEPDEDHLFFGREKQIDDLLGRLRRTRFLGIVGASGSGKSSLVRSGLIPSLYSGYMVQAGSSWRVALLRPGGDPIGNLAAALDAPGVLGSDHTDGGMNRALVEATLRRSALGLVDCVKHARVPAADNVLVFVDQFEELFRFKHAKTGATVRDEAVAFVKLLLEVTRQNDQRMFVVLTMRSEFIGHCTEFPGLAEAVNEGQYLVPRMTRDEVRLAITGPVAVGGGEIAVRLVTRVLNDVGDHADQLPILQHALMRTWNYWEQHQTGSQPIDLADYEAIGTMTDALSKHAEEAYGELAPGRQQEIAEQIFKALTETSGQAGGIRRPCTVKELCLITGATRNEVVEVIDRFRIPGRSFLMPPTTVALDDHSIIDLSHESLMRVWTRLIAWTYEEVRSAEVYRRLSQAAQLHEEGEAGLWRDPELQAAVNWRKTHHPTATWAQRYAPDFDRAMTFLDESRKARDLEVANKERQLVWMRRVAVALATLCLVAILSGVYAVKKRADAEASARSLVAALADARQSQEAARKSAAVAIGERQNAEERKREADTAKEVAISEQRRAELEADRATAEQANAQRQTLVAVQQSRIAEAEKLEADRRRVEALAAEAKAEAARVDAETQSQRAVAEKTAADAARTEAERLGRLTLARALAAKVVGQWDASQRQLAALLARQAYLLMKENRGDPDDADIYAALRTSVSLLAPSRERIYQGHDDAVRAVQLTPDGMRLITGSDDGRIRLFDAGSSGVGTVIGTLDSPIRSLAIDATGNRLAVGAFDGSIYVWDLQRPKVVPPPIAAHTAATSALAFDPRGRLVSGGLDGRIRTWERELAGPGRLLRDNPAQRILALAVSRDGNTLAAGSDGGGLLLWDLRDLSAPPRALDGDRRVSSVAFSGDGRLVASGTQEGKITCWDIAPGARQPMVKTATAHAAGVTGLRFGRTLLASSSLDGTVKLWRVDGGVDLDRPIVLTDRGAWMWAVALSPADDRVFSAAADRRVRSWTTRTESLANEVCTLVSTNLTTQQWNEYVSDKVQYEATCPNRTVSPSAR